MEDISKVELSYGKKRTKELVKVAIILNITLIELISKIKKEDNNTKKGNKNS